MSFDKMQLQKMADIFNKQYLKAAKTSKPEDWINASLSARQMFNEMKDQEIVNDIFEELERKS